MFRIFPRTSKLLQINNFRSIYSNVVRTLLMDMCSYQIDFICRKLVKIKIHKAYKTTILMGHPSSIRPDYTQRS